MDPISLRIFKAWDVKKHMKRVMISPLSVPVLHLVSLYELVLLRNSFIRARPISIFEEINHQLLPEPTE
jgi:hypothetical protein